MRREGRPRAQPGERPPEKPALPAPGSQACRLLAESGNLPLEPPVLLCPSVLPHRAQACLFAGLWPHRGQVCVAQLQVSGSLCREQPTRPNSGDGFMRVWVSGLVGPWRPVQGLWFRLG